MLVGASPWAKHDAVATCAEGSLSTEADNYGSIVDEKVETHSIVAAVRVSQHQGLPSHATSTRTDNFAWISRLGGSDTVATHRIRQAD